MPSLPFSFIYKFLIICTTIVSLPRTFEYSSCLFRMMDRVAPNRREETNVGYPAVSRVIECMTKLDEGQFWANNSVKSFVSSGMTNIEPLVLEFRPPCSMGFETRCLDRN